MKTTTGTSSLSLSLPLSLSLSLPLSPSLLIALSKSLMSMFLSILPLSSCIHWLLFGLPLDGFVTVFKRVLMFCLTGFCLLLASCLRIPSTQTSACQPWQKQKKGQNSGLLGAQDPLKNKLKRQKSVEWKAKEEHNSQAEGKSP